MPAKKKNLLPEMAEWVETELEQMFQRFRQKFGKRETKSDFAWLLFNSKMTSHNK